MNRKTLYIAAFFVLTACAGVVKDKKSPNESPTSMYKSEMVAGAKAHEPNNVARRHEDNLRVARMMGWINLSRE